MKRYNPKEIEPKWQQRWLDDKTFHVIEDSSKPKKYIIDMFPYPSGAAMHVGHVRNFTISDVLSQFHRQKGYNVMHAMGWDTFGLPAENYAIKTGTPPAVTTKTNIANFKHQLSMLGMSYDWSREINTSDPSYYKWTQWIFTQLFENGLAYQKESPQWWCPVDKTVLANEQVEAGRCWRCGNQVVKKNLNQWFFKITAYADALLAGIDDLDWPEKIKTMQHNWIGRSQGAEIQFVIGDAQQAKDSLKFRPALTKLVQSGEKTVTFRVEAKDLAEGDYVSLITRFSPTETGTFGVGKVTKVEIKKLGEIPLDFKGHEPFTSEDARLADFRKYYGDAVTNDTDIYIYHFEKVADIVTVFTTRPDTIFGATFMVLAPEHELVGVLTTEDQKAAVEAYVRATQAKSDIERQENKEKTGVPTGAYAVNPANGERIPVWIADYVLVGHGTGAIMAVPAHDERDYAFAKKFGLPVTPVVAPAFDANAPFSPNAIDTPVAVVVLRNPQTDTYCVLEWDDTAPTKAAGFDMPGGRLNPGETVEAAARRELAEETGYHDVRIVETLPAAVAVYYRDSQAKDTKQVFRAIKHIVVAELANESVASTQGADSYEQGHYKVRWMTREEITAARFSDDMAAALQFAFSQPIYTGEGMMINSGKYDNLQTSEAREQIVADLEKRGVAKERVNYKIRDWLISRQRYWGAPIPIIHCEKDGPVAVPEQDLPVVLPEVKSFEPTGEGSVLATVADWVNTTCPKCGGPAKRETDTMDGYACSSWYFLRYTDPHNAERAWDPAKANYWLPIDYYCGGDHAVSHLLYSRFWMHFFADQGWIEKSRREPVGKLVYNGYILAHDGQKMSKSKGNVVNPDDLIEQGYGADSVRLFEMFIAPYDQNTNWNTNGVPGTFRFLQRVWTLSQKFLEASEPAAAAHNADLVRATHQTIKAVTRDLENLSFNTAVASMMEYVNTLYKLNDGSFAAYDEWRFALESLVQLLAPFAPHIAEELWQQFGHEDSVHLSHWPEYNEQYLVADTLTIVVQVNGKVRAQLQVVTGTSQEAILDQAKTNDRVKPYLDGQTIKKSIYVPGKLVNLVV